VNRIWYGDDLFARCARVTLAPAELIYRGAVAARNALYDADSLDQSQINFLGVRKPIIPAMSVGNLTVGGTGKTPIAAWVAGQLRAQGAKPAVILRGYAGGDEVDVHRRLTPGIPVIGDADRVRGVVRAAAEGATVAVLDDAFQHRRIARVCDVVLVSADAWTGSVRLLPAGPWREPLTALGRATVVIVTRKAASLDRAEAVIRAVGPLPMPVAVASLSLGDLTTLAGASQPLDTLRGTTVHAVAGIGDAAAFFAQLTAAGARVVPHAYRDHHAFTAVDASHVARAAAGAPVVCTLKDAVKLEPQWPRQAGPLWYVSQRVTFDRGHEAVLASLAVAYRTLS
jgi:tetraacyldisaccharide 4'-kinase